MSGRFVFLLLVFCIIVAFVDGHRRCHRRRKCCDCGCGEAQSSSTNGPTEASSMSPSSLSSESATSRPTVKATIPTTKSTIPSTKSTTTPSKSTSMKDTTKHHRQSFETKLITSTKSTIIPPKSTKTKGTSKPTTKMTIPSTKSTIIPPKSTSTKGTSKPTTKTTIPSTKSTIIPPKSTSTKVTSKPTTKTTIPSTKSRITPSKSTTAKSCVGSCPSGWKLYNNYCYKFVSIGFKNEPNYEDICVKNNSQLVSIHSLQENNFVASLSASSSPGKPPHGIWIGLMFVNPKNRKTSPMYWTDQPNVYLKSGDYGYPYGQQFPWDPKDASPAKCNAMWIANTLHPRGQWDDIPCDEGVRFINGAVCKQASNKCPPAP